MGVVVVHKNGLFTTNSGQVIQLSSLPYRPTSERLDVLFLHRTSPTPLLDLGRTHHKSNCIRPLRLVRPTGPAFPSESRICEVIMIVHPSTRSSGSRRLLSHRGVARALLGAVGKVEKIVWFSREDSLRRLRAWQPFFFFSGIKWVSEWGFFFV